MNSSVWYVLAGFLVVALISFGFVAGYTLAFQKLFKIKMTKIWSKLLLTTIAWLLSTIIPVMFVSNFGLLPFLIAITALFLVSGFLLSYKVFKLNLKQAIFYSLGFSAIISPIWYFLFTG